MSKSARTAKRKAEMEQQAKRDGAAICGAHKGRGRICMAKAGAGTDHPGTGRCKYHTGATRAGKLSAAREQMNGMAVARQVSPAQAIQAALGMAAGHVAHTSQKVSELTDEELHATFINRETGIPQVVENVWLTLQREALKDMAKFAKLAHDMGIAERGMTLKEMQTQMAAQLLQGVLGELGLTEAQRKKVAPAIREVSRRLGTGEEPSITRDDVIDAEPVEVLR